MFKYEIKINQFKKGQKKKLAYINR
jgi:hypothetical protein